MKKIQKFRDLPDWQEFRKAMKEAGMDPNGIAEIGEIEGDSLDLVETAITLEEAFSLGSRRSRQVDLGGRGK